MFRKQIIQLSEGVSKTPLGPVLPSDLVAELVDNQASVQSDLQADYESFSDEQARLHFGSDEPLDYRHLRNGIRYCHAWRLHALRTRIGSRLGDAKILDVGDTDGLILKHLGKTGTGFNLSPAAIANIESNGIEARLGDGHDLPFEDDSFDYVFCFETLEHVESPIQILDQLERVCKPTGRLFVSIPWVPRTFVHSRDFSIQRGYGHIFEFCRDDFTAMLTHTKLEIMWETVCDVLGPPSRPVHRAFLLAMGRKHLVAGMFRRFQFFELGRRSDAASS